MLGTMRGLPTGRGGQADVRFVCRTPWHVVAQAIRLLSVVV